MAKEEGNPNYSFVHICGLGHHLCTKLCTLLSKLEGLTCQNRMGGVKAVNFDRAIFAGLLADFPSFHLNMLCYTKMTCII